LTRRQDPERYWVQTVGQ